MEYRARFGEPWISRSIVLRNRAHALSDSVSSPFFTRDASR